ncbi:MAG TPA: 1-(5-phosphoribosyl)-5-[(5-phosphoribosylamino)methylideneamino]imidazole-4-carboxamide isomerase [Planctomycetaceae bacterium]|nr:1-(5-phosphoribosyl)-5-[(5-phosphoribosylamino)methylideneamino]imidazole-4-carboxamide isomerase [Planctomycetaceae bacterium]
MRSMDIWPAIDLRGGKCVRLRQGDFAAETVYGDDPLAMAEHWCALGAERLHLVDLDGARTGEGANRAAIASIISRCEVPCQIGGGIRTEEAITGWLETGAAQVVIGTAAVERPDWFAEMAKRYPGRLVLGVDARDGRVAISGWEASSPLTVEALVDRHRELPLAAVVYTDIARDGTLAGPNLEAMAAMAAQSPWPVIASGGVASLEDVSALTRTGVAGCIVGRALYEGTVTLPDLLEIAEASKHANGVGKTEAP